MSIWAVVPVKPLKRGKSRLSSVLTEGERAKLNYSMLKKTLETLKDIPEIQEVIVISRDPSALCLARDFNARTVQEGGRSELNKALMRATKVAQTFAAQKVLVIPADLPLINAEVVREFLQLSQEPPEIVIAPDRREDGTNALLVNPCGLIDYAYGAKSFHRHMDDAKKKGARVSVFHKFPLELDLDLPEDLKLLSQLNQTFLNDVDSISPK